MTIADYLAHPSVTHTDYRSRWKLIHAHTGPEGQGFATAHPHKTKREAQQHEARLKAEASPGWTVETRIDRPANR